MKISLIEIQILISALIFLPVAMVLIIAFLRGGFKRVENAKYIVTAYEEEDYWSSDRKDGQAHGKDKQ